MRKSNSVKIKSAVSVAASRSPLGRLAALGIERVEQVPLFLPTGWDDFRYPIADFAQLEVADGATVTLRVHLRYPPEVRRDGRVPRLVGRLYDMTEHGRIGFTAFGDVRPLQKLMSQVGVPMVVSGKIRIFEETPWLGSVQVVEPEWVGRLRPRYPGKPRVITPEASRQKVLEFFEEGLPGAVAAVVEAIGESDQTLMEALDLADEWDVAELIRAAHFPPLQEAGAAAQDCLGALAAWAALRAGRRAVENSRQTRTPLPLAALEPLLAGVPFALTAEQREAVDVIRADLGSATVMRRVLSGDVGCGKTVVFATALAGVVAAGGRVAVLAPGEILAEQIHRNVVQWWPHLADHIILVTGSTPNNLVLKDYRWLIGTTALLFRDIGVLDAVVVDEQQRFSRDQREALGSQTHLLEATATCIPRSLALVRYAGLPVTRLRQIHVEKRIMTRIIGFEGRVALFAEAKAVLARNEPLVIIYPKRNVGDEDPDAPPSTGIDDVETAARAWEKFAPGQVRAASGARAQADNIQAVADIRTGAAKVLVTTTVIEVGIDLPNLFTMIVVRPDRLGLTTLHQLRGRLARAGGEGQFLMYLPEPVKDATMERLQVMERETDGFRIAQADLDQRGFGDLDRSSERQVGSAENLLIGRPLDPQYVDTAIKYDDRLRLARDGAARAD